MKRILLVTLVTLAACKKDATAPVPPLVVTVATGQRVSGASRVENGATVFACSYAIQASANGGGAGDHATWVSAQLDWRLTSSGARDQTFLTQTDLIDYFKSDRIASGQTQLASRTAWWSGPFTLLYTLRYQMPNSEQRSATYFLECV